MGKSMYYSEFIGREKHRTDGTRKDRRSNDMSQEEIQRTLNWMLMHNIIDQLQYSQLLTKSLPYTR